MKRILVVGDIITDIYTECTFKKMCPDALDAPAVIMTDRFGFSFSKDIRPGGAANVAVNVSALSENVIIDLIGSTDIQTLNAIKRISCGKVLYHGSLSSGLKKNRIVCDGRIVCRIDNAAAVFESDAEAVSRNLEEYFKECNPDIIIFSDYAGKTINEYSLSMLLKHREKLLIDTKEKNLSIFKGSLMAKLNREEWREVIKNDHSPESHFESLIVTDGAFGAEVIVYKKLASNTSGTHSIFVKGIQTETIDVCGCGDTFIAGLAISMLEFNDPFTAAMFANAAASTVVSKDRTSVADLKETLKLIGRG